MHTHVIAEAITNRHSASGQLCLKAAVTRAGRVEVGRWIELVAP